MSSIPGSNRFDIELGSSGYGYLLGKRKDQVMKMHGKENNDYGSDRWAYYLKTDWYGYKVYLRIYFENDRVNKVKVIKVWDYLDGLIS